MAPLFASSTRLIHADFPDGISRVFTAGDIVRGTINLTLAYQDSAKKGKQQLLKMESLSVKLRVVQTSTYHRSSNNSQETRRETITLYSDDKSLWQARSQPLPDPNRPPPVLQLPFEFQLPLLALGLPPSFEGGTRSGSPLGSQVGRIAYFIKIHGKKQATFSIDERISLPFFYMQPSLVHPLSVPPPLVSRPTEEKQTLSVSPPPVPLDGFQTMVIEKDFRESLFGKKSRLVLKLTLPSLPALPRNHPIPFHLTLLLLAPPSSASSSAPQLNMPSPSDLQIILVRKVFTKARGGSQSFHQQVGTLVDLKKEPRVWYTPHEWKHDRGESRWGGEIVVAGEMMIGGAAGPSFGCGSTRGLLSCEYFVRLRLPLRGTMNNLDVDPFIPLVVTANVQVGQQQSSLAQADLPPGYLEVDAKFGDDVKEK